MKRTVVLALLGAIGLLAFGQPAWAAHPICGTWRMKEPGGEADLRITESLAGDGTFDVQQIGLGNCVGWGTFKDGVLTVHWVTGDLRGFFRWEVDREHQRGHGKTVFTHYPADWQSGEERRIDGRRVREIPDVSLRRVSR